MAESEIKYIALSDEIQNKILDDKKHGWVNPYRAEESEAVRRLDLKKDRPTLWRPVFIRDIEKVIHLPYYNRYADKTQVFSFYENDDITRRALHVQLVSRIARNIGSLLGLNLDLIEAISLGHDIGHTPFGHAGERFLDELLFKETGIHFNHNVHSVRVLDKIFERNLTLQTLDGVLCHNGEFEQEEYRPSYDKTFLEFDTEVENCETLGKPAIKRLVPTTLEGCVVRICDIIAYLGKDRQDARRAKIIPPDYKFETNDIGVENAGIINNMTVDIIENSYGKNYIKMSPKAFADLRACKDENTRVIYRNSDINAKYNEIIRPMFSELYYKLLDDLNEGREDSIIYRHHIKYIQTINKYYGDNHYEKTDPNLIVSDFIASMTDDYFISLHRFYFPLSKYKVEYVPYFDPSNDR